MNVETKNLDCYEWVINCSCRSSLFQTHIIMEKEDEYDYI